jgi:hypothetical protein
MRLPPETRGAPPTFRGVDPAQLRKLCRFSSALEPRSLSTLVDKLFTAVFTRLAESHPDPTGFTGLRRSLACTGNPTKVC